MPPNSQNAHINTHRLYTLQSHPPSNPTQFHTSYLSNSRQSQLTAALPRQNLRNSMSDSNPRLLNLLLRKTGGNADFQRWLEFPLSVLAAGRDGHALEAGYEDAVCECLL
jgi:hypothetical protein